MSILLLKNLRIKIYADGASFQGIQDLAKNALIKGFTTNPTLMHQAGVENYEAFARKVLSIIPSHPISFEVFADTLAEMEKQARYIASWGSNVNVKIPITNTKGEYTLSIIEKLSKEKISLNITAVTTLEQVQEICQHFNEDVKGIISVFAGRVADTGVDPEKHMMEALKIMKAKPQLELLWASPRELFNIIQADRIGCDIITVSHALLEKLYLVGKDLTQYSLETVQGFAKDAQASNFNIQY